MTERTTLSDRMKMYEQPSIARRAFKGQPLVVRLDGKNFHNFCKGLKRPFDDRLSELMQKTMIALVDRFQPLVGYTQSDEITLVWYLGAHDSAEYPFDGRFQKMESLLAGFATAFFNTHLGRHIPEKAVAELMPHFDARAFVVPGLQEAYHSILWRQQDATKNAISMAAQSMFSHKSLQGLHGPEMQEKMWNEKGVNFNDYPARFKRGVFAKRVTVTRPMTDADYMRIHEDYWPIGRVITRTEVRPFDCWMAREPGCMDILFGDLMPTGDYMALKYSVDPLDELVKLPEDPDMDGQGLWKSFGA